MATIFMAAYTNYRRDPRVRREAEALAEAGHRVVFLSRRQPGEPDAETIAGVEVIKAPGLKEKCDSFGEYLADYLLFFAITFLHLLCHPRRYRLIHINNMPDFLVFAACVPRLLGVPVIHDVHDLMPELFLEKFAADETHWGIHALKLQEHWAGRFASAVLTVEDRLKTILSERGIPKRKIHVLMNLPDDRIFAAQEPPPPKPDGAPFVMVYHGTLARRLGIDIAIEAAAKIREHIPAMELRIIGAGEERERLIALSERLGLQAIVTFSTGYVPVETIPGLIRDADAGIVPLRACSGTDIMLPTKLLEYVTLGIPSIVPKTRTIGRYFDADMVQFFEAGDSDSLAAAMVELYHDPARRTALSVNAAERFGKLYHWSRHKDVYLNLVRTLIADQAG
ncbi:glycosyltransferase family 4 protein [Methylomicrobium agile]|uniref:glycosyltransferase family 4 protein n=1 Tax=Methylomicrobium agile TaxID=39774 RepID=UPI0004DFA542|nr:glycosyltransferase family 4 protein [Methylomicrobium agile]